MVLKLKTKDAMKTCSKQGKENGEIFNCSIFNDITPN